MGAKLVERLPKTASKAAENGTLFTRHTLLRNKNKNININNYLKIKYKFFNIIYRIFLVTVKREGLSRS